MNELYNFPFSVKEDLTVTEVSEFRRSWIVPAVMLEMGKVYEIHLFEDGTGYIEESKRGQSLQRKKARASIHRAGPANAPDSLRRSRKQQGPIH